MKIFLVALIVNLLIPLHINAQRSSDAILGKWKTTDDRLEINVYKENQDFKAKVIWFKDINNQEMNDRVDEKNPNKALRKRKWLGMEVLRNMRYDPGTNEWIDGIIYDAKHGRDWDSVAWINEDHLLNVKGYWLFKFISETLTFRKVDN